MTGFSGKTGFSIAYSLRVILVPGWLGLATAAIALFSLCIQAAVSLYFLVLRDSDLHLINSII
jgi:hypothetical protein